VVLKFHNNRVETIRRFHVETPSRSSLLKMPYHAPPRHRMPTELESSCQKRHIYHWFELRRSNYANLETKIWHHGQFYGQLHVRVGAPRHFRLCDPCQLLHLVSYAQIGDPSDSLVCFTCTQSVCVCVMCSEVCCQ